MWLTRCFLLSLNAPAMRGPEAKLKDRIVRRFKDEGWLVISNVKVGQAGWPDLVLYKNGEAVFFEVKAPKGRPSELQLYWLERIRAAGFKACVVRSLEDCVDCIRS